MALKCRQMSMRPQGKTKSSFEDRIQSVTEQRTQSSSYTRLRQTKTKCVFLSLFFYANLYQKETESMSISACCWPTAVMKMVLTALVVIWPWLQTT